MHFDAQHLFNIADFFYSLSRHFLHAWSIVLINMINNWAISYESEKKKSFNSFHLWCASLIWSWVCVNAHRMQHCNKVRGKKELWTMGKCEQFSSSASNPKTVRISVGIYTIYSFRFIIVILLHFTLPSRLWQNFGAVIIKAWTKQEKKSKQ